MTQEPARSKEYCAARLLWARQNIFQGDAYRRKTIFLDEKKLNLDGPDENQLYWRDLRNEKHRFSTRAGDGASVMVWGVISFYDASKLDFFTIKARLK